MMYRHVYLCIKENVLFNIKSMAIAVIGAFHYQDCIKSTQFICTIGVFVTP